MFFVSRWPRRWRGLTSQALDRFAFSRVQMDIFASSKLLQSSDIRWIFKWAALVTSTSTKFTFKPTCSSATFSNLRLSEPPGKRKCLPPVCNECTEWREASKLKPALIVIVVTFVCFQTRPGTSVDSCEVQDSKGWISQPWPGSLQRGPKCDSSQNT